MNVILSFHNGPQRSDTSAFICFSTARNISLFGCSISYSSICVARVYSHTRDIIFRVIHKGFGMINLLDLHPCKHKDEKWCLEEGVEYLFTFGPPLKRLYSNINFDCIRFYCCSLCWGGKKNIEKYFETSLVCSFMKISPLAHFESQLFVFIRFGHL